MVLRAYCVCAKTGSAFFIASIAPPFGASWHGDFTARQSSFHYAGNAGGMERHYRIRRPHGLGIIVLRRYRFFGGFFCRSFGNWRRLDYCAAADYFADGKFSDAYAVQMSVATSLAVIVVTAVPSFLTHAKGGRVFWRIAAWMLTGACVGAPLVAIVAQHIPGKIVQGFLILFMLHHSWHLFFNRRSPCLPRLCNCPHRYWRRWVLLWGVCRHFWALAPARYRCRFCRDGVSPCPSPSARRPSWVFPWRFLAPPVISSAGGEMNFCRKGLGAMFFSPLFGALPCLAWRLRLSAHA